MTAGGTDYARGLRLSVIGLFINAALATVKLLAGLIGHSYALIADAVESMTDIFGSVVVWGGLRIASQPADEDHPYGHGRAETLAALVVALMIFAAGIGIAVQSTREIVRPHHAPAPFTLGVLLAVVVIKETLFRIERRVAWTTASGAVLADAWHHRSDAITSAAAGIGITVALIGGRGYESADDWAALLAAGIIFFNAYRILMPPLHELMDAEPTQIIDRARTVAVGVPGVQGVEKVFARKSGTQYWVDMHIEVDPAMSVHQAHALSHEVKDTIRRNMPAVRDVLIHIEPHRAPDQSHS